MTRRRESYHNRPERTSEEFPRHRIATGWPVCHVAGFVVKCGTQRVPPSGVAIGTDVLGRPMSRKRILFLLSLVLVLAAGTVLLSVVADDIFSPKAAKKSLVLHVDDPGSISRLRSRWENSWEGISSRIRDYFARFGLCSASGFPSLVKPWEEVHFVFSNESRFRSLFTRMEHVAMFGGWLYILQKDATHSVRISFGPYEGHELNASEERVVILVVDVDENGFRKRLRRIAYASDYTADNPRDDEPTTVVELYCSPEAKCTDVFEAAATFGASVEGPVLVARGSWDRWVNIWNEFLPEPEP